MFRIICVMFEKTFKAAELKRKPGLRQACRGVLIDENGKILLLFVSRENYYKLPGGGMEGDEDKIGTLKREVKEEAGCEITDIKEIGQTIEEISNWKQISYCFVGRVVSKGNAEYTSDEIYDGFTLKWVDINEALSVMKDIVPTTENGKRKKERETFILEKSIEELRNYVKN